MWVLLGMDNPRNHGDVRGLVSEIELLFQIHEVIL